MEPENSQGLNKMKNPSFSIILLDLIRDKSIGGNPIPTSLKEIQSLFGEKGDPEGATFYKFNNWQCFLNIDGTIQYISLKSISDWNKEDKILLNDKLEFLHIISEQRLSNFLDKHKIKWSYVPWQRTS